MPQEVVKPATVPAKPAQERKLVYGHLKVTITTFSAQGKPSANVLPVMCLVHDANQEPRDVTPEGGRYGKLFESVPTFRTSRTWDLQSKDGQRFFIEPAVYGYVCKSDGIQWGNFLAAVAKHASGKATRVDIDVAPTLG